MKRTIWQIVVYCVLFRRKLREEQLCQIRDPFIRVLQRLCHLAQLAFHFYHTIQDQMRQHHQGVLLHYQVLV